jgi:hypothetical protein
LEVKAAEGLKQMTQVVNISEHKYESAVKEAKDILSQNSKNIWRLAEIAASLEPVYGESTLEHFADDIDLEYITIWKYRNTFEAWKSIQNFSQLKFWSATELNRYPDKSQIITERPNITKCEARQIMVEYDHEREQEDEEELRDNEIHSDTISLEPSKIEETLGIADPNYPYGTCENPTWEPTPEELHNNVFLERMKHIQAYMNHAQSLADVSKLPHIIPDQGLLDAAVKALDSAKEALSIIEQTVAYLKKEIQNE